MRGRLDHLKRQFQTVGLFGVDVQPHAGGAGKTGQRADAGAPVIKNLVDRLLRQRADVMAFHSAPPAQGGTGAVLVLLARRR